MVEHNESSADLCFLKPTAKLCQMNEFLKEPLLQHFLSFGGEPLPLWLVAS
jgi:hypothetical protein